MFDSRTPGFLVRRGMLFLQRLPAVNPMMMVLMLSRTILAIAIRRDRFFQGTAERLRPRRYQRKLPIIIRLRGPDGMAMCIELDIRASRFRLAQLGQIGCLRNCSRRGLPHTQLGGRVEERERHAAGAAYEPLLFILGHGVGRFRVYKARLFCERITIGAQSRKAALLKCARTSLGRRATEQDESWEPPQPKVVYT